MKYGRSRNEETVKPRKRRLKTKPLLVLIGILLICNLFWFVAWIIPSKPQSIEMEEVASVNGEPITREEWMVAMEKEVGRDTLRDLVNAKVMEAAAKEYGIDVTEKEIDLELALIHSVDNHSYTGLDANNERQKIRSALILEKVLTKDVVIDYEVIESNYNENASLYNISTAYRTAVIILPSKDEAEQTLKELADGSNFNVLAKERSIDAVSASLGGDLGYINNTTENIDEAIAEAAAVTRKGTTSSAVPLRDGTYAIVHVSDLIKGQSFKYNEVKDHIRRQLAIGQLSESVSPEAFWKEFDAKWFYEE